MLILRVKIDETFMKLTNTNTNSHTHYYYIYWILKKKKTILTVLPNKTSIECTG
jgi:hypothetical protein